jgi:hypothetical protein
MYSDRIGCYKKLEKEFKTKIITYITSDRRGFETQIAQDVIDLFINQLDGIGVVPKISLFLYTQGGDTAAAWNIVNLLKMYCDELEVIIPHKAHSAGTIISLGANRIIMTKQATLGPIDPSLTTPLNPKVSINGNDLPYPVSVEAVKGYIEFAKEQIGNDENALAQVILNISQNVHPLVLGQVYRTRSQIKMLAEKLLKNQIDSAEEVDKITSFLCSDSGSHDYTINRREAKNDLGLNVKKPSEKQYALIKQIYDDVSNEMGFRDVFDPRTINGAYVVKRGLLESISGGSDYFVTEGRCNPVRLTDGQIAFQNEITYEGWRKDIIADNKYATNSILDKEGDVIYEHADDDGL